MTIPLDVRADLHERYGHALAEYDGLTEALFDHELSKTKKAAPSKERPRFFSVRMSLPPRSVVERACVGVVLRKPANSA